MIAQQTTPLIVANRLRKLVEDAPAGGLFHGCRQSDVGKDVSAPERKTSFVQVLRDGRSYKVTVEQI